MTASSDLRDVTDGNFRKNVHDRDSLKPQLLVFSVEYVSRTPVAGARVLVTDRYETALRAGM